MYYKLGQACVTIRESFVLFQIRAYVVTNWGKMYYKLGQVLQIRAIIKMWDIICTINCWSLPESISFLKACLSFIFGAENLSKY